MLDIALALEHREAVMKSEMLRGRFTSSSIGIVQLLNLLQETWNQVRFYRIRAKEVFSQSLQPNTTKLDREHMRNVGFKMESHADALLHKCKQISMRNFGNYVSLTAPLRMNSVTYDENEQTWLWQLASLVKNLFAKRVKVNFDFMQDLLLQVDHIDDEDCGFALYAARLYFDPSKHCQEDILGRLVTSNAVAAQVSPNRLSQAAAYSIVLLSEQRRGEIMCKISYETDYVARELNRKLKKRNQTYIFQHTFLVEWFCNPELSTVVAVEEEEEEKEKDELQVLVDALDGSAQPNTLLANHAEDMLEFKSFLGGGSQACALDARVFAALRDNFQDFPKVQFPALLRWAKHMSHQQAGFPLECAPSVCRCGTRAPYPRS